MPDLIPRFLSNVLTVDQVETILNKTISGLNNTFSNIPNSALTQITDKTKLHDEIVYKTIGAFNQTILQHQDVILTSLADSDILKYRSSDSKWINAAGALLGEANTYTNAGVGGIGIILTKSGVNLPFKSIFPKSSKVLVTDGGANNRVEIDVNLTAYKLDAFSTPDDNTNLNVTTTYHGLVPKLPNDANKYLNGIGAWATVAGGTVDDAGIIRVNGTGINAVARKINFTSDFTGTDQSATGQVDIDIKDASTTQKGIVQLATDNESTAGEACQSNDTRLSNARTPTAHATSHKTGGTDSIKLDELAAPTDITTLNATISLHGLLPKLGGGTTNYLRADGTWAEPAGASAGALVRNVIDTTVGNSQTHTDVLSFTFAENQMGTNKIIHGVVKGYITYNSGTPKLGLEIILGTTTLYSMELGTIDAFASPRPFEVDFEMVNKGIHNSQSLNGEFSVNTRHNSTPTNGFGDVSTDEDQQEGKIYGTSTEATNVAKTLTVKLWNTTSSSSVSFTRTMSYIEMK